MELLSKKEVATYQLLRDNHALGINRYEKLYNFTKKHGFSLGTLRSLEKKGMIKVATLTVHPWVNSHGVNGWVYHSFIEVYFE